MRIGFGRGEEVADGRWAEAIDARAARAAAPARAALRPQERLAALLGGRDAALACEALVLRARADLDAGRLREAALQLRVAIEAAIAELEAWRERSDLAERLDELRRCAPGWAAPRTPRWRAGSTRPTRGGRGRDPADRGRAARPRRLRRGLAAGQRVT